MTAADSPASRTELSHDELTQLLALGEQLASELDPEVVLALVAEAACRVVDAETLVVPIIDAEKRTFTYRAASGEHAELVCDQTFDIHEGNCGWVMKHRRPLLFGVGGSYDIDATARWQPGMASSLLVPLICRGEISGGLSAMGKRGGGAFDARDLTLLTLFANQASIAIDNARLFRQVAAESERLQLVLDSTSEAIYGIDTAGNCTFANPACLRLLGYREEAELLGSCMHDLTHHCSSDGVMLSEDASYAHLAIRDRCETHADGELHRRSDGVSFPVEGWAHPIWQDAQVVGAVVTFIDISERQQATQALALVTYAMNHVTESAYLSDAEGRFHYVNDAACSALGHSRDELLGLRVIDVDANTSSQEQWSASWETIKAQKSLTFESRHARADGGDFPVEVNANYFEFLGQPYVLGLVRDVSERKQAEEQIHSLAYFDPLTQLPNRRLLLDRLGQAMIAGQRSGEFGALMMLDLDNFKVLNDTRGHDVGDLLLVAVAQRLLDNLRAEDTVSRLGGDEYVLMVEGLGRNEAQAAAQAEAVAEKIRLALNQPHVLGTSEYPHQSTPSIGLTLFKGQDTPIDALLKQADLALYQAKGAGRNAIRFFNPAMQAAIEARSALETALRHALQQGELRLLYQPQFDDGGAIIGAEALIRWLPPGRAMVSPAEFIPLAEETGLIVPIGAWVIDTACAQITAWAGDPAASVRRISVNVSARQFQQPDFVAHVRNALAHSGANPARLTLELTESAVLGDVEEAIGRMNEIKVMGVGFSLDDFGTGFSSLSYLKRLPLDEVKIDQSFIRDVTDDPNDAAIVRAILAMSDSLGLEVIAEGVETQAQQDFLRAAGCSRYQGYLFGRPLPIEDWDRPS